MSGCWYYTEHPDEKQTAGCYLYEPGGSIHQFNTPADNTGDTDTFMVVSGANINFDTESGEYLNTMDAGAIKSITDAVIAERGLAGFEYISANVATVATFNRG